MVLSEPSDGDIGWKKYFIASWAFTECLLFGGLLYGWGSLVFVLKEEGVYANLCPDYEYCVNASNVTDNTSSYEICAPSFNFSSSNNSVRDENKRKIKKERCIPQDEKMALCFTIASAVFCAGCAVMGHINYKFGTRVTRIIAFGIIMILTQVSLSVAIPWLIFPGLSTMSVGGLSLYATNIQVANLFTRGSSTVVSILSGGFDTSSTVRLIVKLAHQSGFARRNMYFVITALHFMTLVSTFGFLPNSFIPRPGPPKVSKGVMIDNGYGTLEHLDGKEQTVSYFTDVCFYTMMGGLVSSLLSGIVYDWRKKVCQKGQTRMYRELMPAVVPLSITCILSVILSILTLIPVRGLLYVIYIVMTVYRGFIYSMAAAFISAVFSSEYFAILYGIMVIIGGMFGFLQFAFFSWSEAYPDAPLHVDICLLLLVLLAFIHPLMIWFKCWREERKFK